MAARIVVGVDGSEASRIALDRAVEEARLRDAVLQPVLAWMPPVLIGPPVYSGLVETRVQARERAGELLERIVAALPPDVEVDPLTVEGSAAHALLDVSRGADLLVVGSRGRGGFAGLLLGSTSHQVTSHAHCPVLVVPSWIE